MGTSLKNMVLRVQKNQFLLYFCIFIYREKTFLSKSCLQLKTFLSKSCLQLCKKCFIQISISQKGRHFGKVVTTTHGNGFFHRGGNIFSVCTWLKNAFSGGDAFGCHCLCEGGGGGGETQFYIHRKKFYLEFCEKNILEIFINS